MADLAIPSARKTGTNIPMTVIHIVVVTAVAIVVVGIDGKNAAVIADRKTETGIHRHGLEIVAHAVHADLNGATGVASTVHLAAM